MKKTLVCVVWLFSVAIMLSAVVPTVQDYTDKVYAEWTKPRSADSDTAFWLIPLLKNDIPSNVRAEVVEKVLNRAINAQPTEDYNVIVFVIGYLAGIREPSDFSPQLEQELRNLAADSHALIRRDIYRVFGSLGRASDHDFIVAGINDPDDEVRSASLQALRGQPDAEATFSKYIQTYNTDSTRKGSILTAQSCLGFILRPPAF